MYWKYIFTWVTGQLNCNMDEIDRKIIGVFIQYMKRRSACADILLIERVREEDLDSYVDIDQEYIYTCKIGIK